MPPVSKIPPALRARRRFPRRAAAVPSALLALFLIAAPPADAQRPGSGAYRGGGGPAITGSISGRVVDAATAAPVEFATLVLKRLPDRGAAGATGGRPAAGRPGGPPAAEPDSARLAQMRARLAERLGREPTDDELAQARARMAARFGGSPNPAPAEEQQADGTVAEADGSFRFAEVPPGRYAVEVSFIGYETLRTDTITLTGRRPDADLGALTLGSSAVALETAVVTAEAELVENRVDKVVYNASQDVANQGGDGADVLRRVPLLSVDLDGNVQLRGSEQVQILINGRPSTMFAGSVGEALQAMPAEEIEKVEVITSPGARYQGEGTAGIINIVTRRGGLKGLTGNVAASIGTRANNANASLNYTRGRFGVNGGLGSRFSWSRPTETSLLRVDTLAGGALRTLSQNAEGNSNWVGLNGNVGAFYDLNAFNAFTTSLRVRGRRRQSDLLERSVFVDPVADLRQEYTQDRENLGPAFNVDWTTDYRRKFDGEDHELNVAFQLGQSVRDQDYDLLLTSQLGDFPERDELGRNEGRNTEYTLQADYQAPLTEALFLETGAQAILRDLNSDYSYLTRGSAAEAYVVDPVRSNVFRYDQDVYAGYVSLRATLGERLSAIAGLRYEGTEIAGSLARPEPGEEPFASDYDNWLPSGSMQAKLSETSNLRAAYSRRIRRPGLRYVNPFVDLSNNRNITVGNPELEPEIAEQVELTASMRAGRAFANASVFYRLTRDEINGFVEVVDGGVSREVFLNLGQSEAWGGGLFVSGTVAEVVKLRGNANVERLELVGQGATAGLSRSVWQGSLNGSITVELPRDLVVESFGFYRAPRQTLQGERASFSIWSVGAQKKFADDRWRLGLRIVEPFSRSKEFPGEITGAGFSQVTNYSVLFRSFGLNASYRFGQLTGNRQRERRSRIDNDDVRDGGGGEF